jgi:serine protease Do
MTGMLLSRYNLIYCFLFLADAVLLAQWPDNINELKQSICLVEYFQPQLESRDIKDEARIKRKITGILVSRSGLVITSDLIYPINLDIVAGDNTFTNLQKPPEDITISFNREKKIKAHFEGKDEELRLAFIRIDEATNLPPPVTFNCKQPYKPGDPLFLIQHLDGRYDNEIFISAGFINGILDHSQQKLLSGITVNPLSPGGLVINKKGQAIGIVSRGSFSARFSEDFESADLLPENEVAEILPACYFIPLIAHPPQLITQKEGGGKSWLGIQMQVLSKDMAEYWNLPGSKGIIVTSIVPLSPAEKAKLQLGDIITSLGGFQIKSDDEKIIDAFRNYVRSLPEGEVNMQILRDHQPMTVKVHLESAPKSQYLADEFFDENLGLRVKELTQDLFLNNDLDFDTEGVWVSRVEEAGAANLAGLEVDDLILSIDDVKIKSLADFREIVQKLEKQQPDYIQVFIQREQITQYVFIKTGLNGK